MINESLLENLTKELYAVLQSEERLSTCTVDLSKGEQNILRYVCGYVGMKRHKCFIKQPEQKAAAFVKCLDHMHAIGVMGPTSAFVEYTKEWVDKVNREVMKYATCSLSLKWQCDTDSQIKFLLIGSSRFTTKKR